MPQPLIDTANDAEWLKEYITNHLIVDDEAGKRDLHTASPHYYCIMDYEKMLTRKGDGDFVEYYSAEYSENYSPRQLIKSWLENGELKLSEDGTRLNADELAGCVDEYYFEDIVIKDGKVDENVDDEDLIKFIDEYIDAVFCLGDWCKNDCILNRHLVENTFFFTREEAEAHLKANYYHYHKDAHTYCMTPWRAPDTCRLFKTLMNIDFDKSNIVFKDEQV